MAAPSAVVPASAPAAPPARPRLLLLGTGMAVAACFMVFAGLFGVYLAARAGVLAEGGVWLPEGTEIPLTPGTMGLFTLFLSVVTMQWSVQAVSNNDRQHALFALGITILFAVAYVNAVTFLYTQMNLGVADTPQAVLIYAITGANIAMVVASIVFTALMTLRTLGGEYAGRDREGIVAAALFWYATIAVSSVVWFAIFVTK